MAKSLAWFMTTGPEISDIRITRVIEGAYQEMETPRLSSRL